MTPDRYRQLTQGLDEEVQLTKDELQGGWHFCWDWDGMLIHQSDPEYNVCSCAGRKHIEALQQEVKLGGTEALAKKELPQVVEPTTK